MKKYTKKSTGTRGDLPKSLFKYIDKAHISHATAQFSEYMTMLAKQFHSQLSYFGPYYDLTNIELDTPKLFGQDVSIEYVASGTTGTVYKIIIGDEPFALKINRSTRMATDEIENMHIYRRMRNLVNRVYIAAPFKNEDNEEYTWLLSAYVGNDSAQSFRRACEKLYFAYITKGIAFSDGHYNNFKDGKIIDSDSFRMRTYGFDDFKKLSRTEIDTVKKLMRFVKIDDKKSFQELLAKANKNVLDYLFFSMVYARGQFFAGRDKDDDFVNRLLGYERMIQEFRQPQNAKNIISTGRES